MSKTKIRKYLCTALALLLTVMSVSCSGEAEVGSSANEAGNNVSVELGSEKKPSGKVDSDAKKLDGIVITTAEELMRIGREQKYPLDGDYFLAADIDLSEYGAFYPIGGYISECGIVEGDNVFSGTFDGRGHTVYGLTLDVSAPERVHVGMFGTVASKDENDPAVIKNLILKNVSVSGRAGGPATYAALIGQADGYVIIDNVALICGEVNVTLSGGDILGIGTLIGQCRTQDWTGCSNNGIHITNVFTNLEVTGENNGRSNYTSGLIGRIRGSDLGTLSNVLQLGGVYHESEKGHAIAAGDSHAKVTENVYYRAGSAVDYNFNGKTKSSRSLLEADVVFGDSWIVESGRYPMLKLMTESELYSDLDFAKITLAPGESSDKVKSGFTVTEEIFGEEILWYSSNESVIRVNGENAEVTKPSSGQVTVSLTASLGTDARTFTLTVDSGIVGKIVYDGESTLIAKNYPGGTGFTWSVVSIVSGKTLATASDSASFTLDDTMLNSIVTLSAQGFDDIHFYYSTIPSVSIESDTAYYDIQRESYSEAVISFYSPAGYETTSYSGKTQIKLRGNSTAYQAKRPFKLKLDKKSDLYGMGESKHWALLANAYDRTNMRNKLSYDFSAELGMVSCESILVNVIYNGEYYGMYELCENIRIDEGRVDILDWEDVAEDVAAAIAKKEKLSSAERDSLEERMTKNLSWITSGKFGDYTISDYYDTSSFDISGGYLIENDAYYDEYSKFTTDNDMKLMIKSPEYLSTNNDMLGYLRDYIQDMEDAIYSPSRYNSDGLHYSEYMDVDSFIDFWMVNQVFKNVELLFKSCYMYKDVGGKLTFGPVWDMDWAAGNHVNLHGEGGKATTWWHSESQDREYWYRALYNDPYFILCLYERWGEISGSVDNIFTSLESLNDEIKESADLDNSRWWYDQSYDAEVTMLRKWLRDRVKWMNEQFETPETLIDSLGYFNNSSKIEIKALSETTDGIELTVESSFDKADLIINGTAIREVSLDGTPISVSRGELRESGKYNSIELIAKDANGSYSVIKKRSGLSGSSAVNADYVYYISK